MMERPNFHFVFLHEEDPYEADVWHYSQLNPKEIIDLAISENSFIVKLKGPYEFKPFEIYIGEDMEWHTQSTFVVDDEIVQKIGLEIHNKTM